MTVLLDTDHISVLQRDEAPAAGNLRVRLKQLREDDAATCIVSFQEQARGWLAYINRARKLDELLEGFSGLHDMLEYYSVRQVMPFDRHALDEFLRLKKQRITIGNNDLRIAAIAKANGVKLLSRNLRDFRLVPGLDDVDDWTV